MPLLWNEELQAKKRGVEVGEKMDGLLAGSRQP